MNNLRELAENGVKVDFVQGAEEKANMVGGSVGHGGQGMIMSHHREAEIGTETA